VVPVAGTSRVPLAIPSWHRQSVHSNDTPAPMRHTLSTALSRLAAEPPFRLVARAAMRYMKLAVRTRAQWELSPRPAYLLGLVTAAEQALRQREREFSAIEFGVAGGDGLVALQDEAESVERETGVKIKVYGFDAGATGLPDFIGDYRDHPEEWRPGDYPMDEQRLRARLAARTTLILGNIAQTVPGFFVNHAPPPIGFVSVDVDLYSSTRDALRILTLPGSRMLWHVPMYFDDIDFLFNHRFAGELLAIDEFNDHSADVKIDRWYGVRNGRPFPERPFLDKLYVAHCLSAISQVVQSRPASVLPLKA
jgi:hypothetical protein